MAGAFYILLQAIHELDYLAQLCSLELFCLGCYLFDIGSRAGYELDILFAYRLTCFKVGRLGKSEKMLGQLYRYQGRFPSLKKQFVHCLQYCFSIAVQNTLTDFEQNIFIECAQQDQKVCDLYRFTGF